MAEDLGAGDRTSQATVAEDARARGRLLAKEELVICGLPLLPRVFGRLGPVSCELLAAEGRLVRSGEVVATVEGGARTLLAGERLVLNLVQHLCGIATLTRRYVERVAGTTLVVRDTRKTVPGMRVLAKYAVRTGGATNHRMALDDAILVKDNHLTLGGGDFDAAVRGARACFPGLPLEVE
ncbi:MAG TPA: nicotinate-nucleotide diphosphorylase (carboxylating), partial [Candidatus Binatia bacterium]|nr:nicotinate-nucleotide diphosphorylase (carboxylating) [Candidatus Binatia bacterium]